MSMAECTRCRLDRRLLRLLTPPHGTIPPGLDKLREGLVRAGRPDHMMDWLNNPGVCPVLQAVAGRGATTNEALDALPPGGTRDHVRTMMVATGVLPPATSASRPWSTGSARPPALADPVSRQVLHGYAVWHHLHCLRGRLDCRAASRGQAKSVQDNVTAAAALIRWLEERGLTLAACTQAGHDQWMTGDSGHRAGSAGFVRWAVRHRQASGLAAPAVRWPGPAGPLDQDRRWTDARRLLHDEGTGLADRVVGLLVLLYAQRLSDITALTTRHLQREGSRTSLLLGSRSVHAARPARQPRRQSRGRPERTRPGPAHRANRLAVPRSLAGDGAGQGLARQEAPRHRGQPAAGPQHRPAHPGRRGPGLDPGEDARHPHPGSRPVSEDLLRRLGRLRRRRQPQGHAAARSVTSGNARARVTTPPGCPVCGSSLQGEGIPRPPAGRHTGNGHAAAHRRGPARPCHRDPAAAHRASRRPSRHRQRPAGAVRRARRRALHPPARTTRKLHRLIAELAALAAAATVTKRATKRLSPAGTPQTPPLFEEAGLSAANDG